MKNAQTALSLIFLQALVAMLGSLYYSNFGDPVANLEAGNLFPDKGFDPCNLCWWGRILMYPIVVISFWGLWKKDYGSFKYIITLAIPGTGLELYHYYLQKFDVATSEFCTFDNPCTAMSVDYFGFMTIPFLCLVAFLVILILSLWGSKK